MDASEGVEQFAHGEAYPDPGCLAEDEPGGHEREQAVEDVHPDLVVGEVEHGREGHHFGVFHLAEGILRFFLKSASRR